MQKKVMEKVNAVILGNTKFKYDSDHAKFNFSRPFWAENGKAWSAMEVKKHIECGCTILQQLEEHSSDTEILACAQQLNDLFLKCPCLEDHELMARLLSWPESLGILSNALVKVDLVYIVLQTLLNFSWCDVGIEILAKNNVVDMILGIVPMATLETAVMGLKLMNAILAKAFKNNVEFYLPKKAIITQLCNITRTTESRNEQDVAVLAVHVVNILFDIHLLPSMDACIALKKEAIEKALVRICACDCLDFPIREKLQSIEAKISAV